jgi:hypothetical protein
MFNLCYLEWRGIYFKILYLLKIQTIGKKEFR